MKHTDIRVLYEELLARHGPQGWWPLYDPRSGEFRYHPGDYTVPAGAERTEVIVGAILAQNTSWTNVVRALHNLNAAQAMSWEVLLDLEPVRLQGLIRPARYFRQKARKLKEAAQNFRELKNAPRREDLLSVWGVGPETADSILLYAYGLPVMVVDAYLRRLLKALGETLAAEAPYEDLRAWVEQQAPRDHAFLNELHALAVAEGKRLSQRP